MGGRLACGNLLPRPPRSIFFFPPFGGRVDDLGKGHSWEGAM